MIYELKKFYKNPAIKILFVIVIFLSISMPIYFIYDFHVEGFDFEKEETTMETGLKAIKNRKERVQKFKGILTEEKLNKSLEYYKSVEGEEFSVHKMEEEYPSFYGILYEGFSPYISVEDFNIAEIKNTKDYYSRNTIKLKEEIDSLGENFLTETEKDEIIKRGEEIDKPFEIDFIGQWQPVISSLFFPYLIIVFLGILISSQIFSFEKENEMDLILNISHKKKLKRIGINKILAMIFYLTIVFLISTIIISGIVFGFVGVSGWNTQIQLLPDLFTSIYNFTIGQMYLYFILISFISIIAITLIGTLVNSICKNTYISLIFTGILTITPMFLANNQSLPLIIQKIMYLQPIDGINIIPIVQSLFTFNLLGKNILLITGIFIIGIIYIVLGFILSPIIFSKRINEN